MRLKTCAAIFGMALTLVLALTATRLSAAPEEESAKLSSGNGKIVGVWDVRVTRRDCQTGDSLGVNSPVMNMFNYGGTLVETSSGSPTRRGPGLGTWEYDGRQRYKAVFRFFRFNIDGSYAGIRRVSRTIELDQDLNEFTAIATDELFDVNGNLFQTGCATEAATRLE